VIQNVNWDDGSSFPSLSIEEALKRVDEICDELDAGQHLLVEDEDGIFHPVFIPAEKKVVE
jgi:hypothetical protein